LDCSTGEEHLDTIPLLLQPLLPHLIPHICTFSTASVAAPVVTATEAVAILHICTKATPSVAVSASLAVATAVAADLVFAGFMNVCKHC